MKEIGFLVVNHRTGFMLEGSKNSAKIFANQRVARGACKPLSDQIPVPLTYAAMVSSLLKGASFSFDSAENHRQFLKAVRNDPANKPMLEYSQDQKNVMWRFKNETSPLKADSGARVAPNPVVATVPAKAPSVEVPVFNAAILVR